MIKILLVDDDAVERTALKGILSAAFNCEFVEASDGQQALDILCDRLRPQLCIVDLNMPRMGGLELIQRLRRDPELQDLTLMVSSASRDRETIVQLAKARISGYLLKPYDVAKTVAAVKPIANAALNTVPAKASRNLLSKTALIVDDDEVSRIALRDIIKASGGWDVVPCRTGTEALHQLHSGLLPDLMVVDLNMPDLDGPSLIRRIREETTFRRLRIAVTSANKDRDQVKALAQLQISGYLIKPFDPAKVAAALAQAAGSMPVGETSTAI